MAILYGPAAGFLIGLIGHGLKDLVFYGMPWFSWVISSAIVGLIIGLVWKKVRVLQILIVIYNKANQKANCT